MCRQVLAVALSDVIFVVLTWSFSSHLILYDLIKSYSTALQIFLIPGEEVLVVGWYSMLYCCKLELSRNLSRQPKVSHVTDCRVVSIAVNLKIVRANWPNLGSLLISPKMRPGTHSQVLLHCHFNASTVCLPLIINIPMSMLQAFRFEWCAKSILSQRDFLGQDMRSWLFFWVLIDIWIVCFLQLSYTHCSEAWQVIYNRFWMIVKGNCQFLELSNEWIDPMPKLHMCRRTRICWQTCVLKYVACLAWKRLKEYLWWSSPLVLE